MIDLPDAPEHDFDVVCAICGARYGDHNAPVPYCPDGDHFRRDSQFEPSPARRAGHYGLLQLLRDSDRGGNRYPVYRAEWAPREDGEEHVAGFSLDNRSDIEEAARQRRNTL